jgi:hypothetical protein
MVKEFPAPTTTKYGPFHCNMIHHIPPSRAHDDSKGKDVIHIDDFTNHSPTLELMSQKKNSKKIKIEN